MEHERGRRREAERILGEIHGGLTNEEKTELAKGISKFKPESRQLARMIEFLSLIVPGLDESTTETELEIGSLPITAQLKLYKFVVLKQELEDW
ncbi:unnamed protein product [Mycena citricolor]|uniref:NET domain-containing protein n=1 Tax=Mycena citricolor TaxID=2018698 RepID=A0AAD2HWI2_9AGAR|nr:unnamed protein product [Mycena citricolor]CAK5282601.1 unnamed protein product [Mycena citricolor]